MFLIFDVLRVSIERGTFPLELGCFIVLGIFLTLSFHLPQGPLGSAAFSFEFSSYSHLKKPFDDPRPTIVIKLLSIPAFGSVDLYLEISLLKESSTHCPPNWVS